jgi:hypothetical protein
VSADPAPRLLDLVAPAPDPAALPGQARWLAARRAAVAAALDGAATDALEPLLAFFGDHLAAGQPRREALGFATPTPTPAAAREGVALAWADRDRHLLAPAGRDGEQLVHRDLGGWLRGAWQRWRLAGGGGAADVVAPRVIDALARAEDERLRAWRRPRLVRRIDWCVPIDRVPAALHAVVVASEGQRAEWRALHGEGPCHAADTDFLRDRPWLMVDTRHLAPDDAAAVAAGLGDLEAALDGWLVAADNRPALRLLTPLLAGRVRCLLTDPPYNTGLQAFAYRDAYRRSSWLALMAETLALAGGLLSPDGSSFVLCDDHEQPRLRLLLDEQLGEDAFVATVVWKKVSARKNKARLSVSHDYLIVHARDAARWPRNLVPRTDAQRGDYRNPDGDPRGPWRSVALSVKSEDGDRRSAWRYPVTTPSGRVVRPPAGRHWNGRPERLAELQAEGRVWFGPGGDRLPRVKVFLAEVQDGIVPDTWWDHDVGGSNLEAKKELLDQVGDLVPGEPFQTPKPVRLFERVLLIATRPRGREWVLDPFAGSGTAALAVLARNRADGGDRRYVLAESGPHFDDVLVPRLKRAVRASRWKAGRPAGADHLPQAFACLRLEDDDAALLAGPGAGLAPEAFERPSGQPFDLLWTVVLLLGLRVRGVTRDGALQVLTGEDPTGAACRVLWRDVQALPDAALRAWLRAHPAPGVVTWANAAAGLGDAAVRDAEPALRGALAG